jgi:hypothetical protein
MRETVESLFNKDSSRNPLPFNYPNAPQSDDDEVACVTRRAVRGIARPLDRRGVGPHTDPGTIDHLAGDEPLLAVEVRSWTDRRACLRRLRALVHGRCAIPRVFRKPAFVLFTRRLLPPFGNVHHLVYHRRGEEGTVALHHNLSRGWDIPVVVPEEG